MKRILSVLLVLVLVLSFAGCSDDKGRILYNVDLEEYVELGEYKGIKIDKNSEEYKTTYESFIDRDIETYGLYVIKREGKVADGDNVNLSATGTKKNGEAFTTGIESGTELVIGSGQFIDGFEDGLIGKEIGSTVELDLTFPEDYHSTDLAGEDVTFKVTINSVNTGKAKEPENYYMSLGFTSVDAYYEDIAQRTMDSLLQQAILENVTVNDYPQADVDFIFDKYYQDFEANVKASYQSIDNYIAYMGITEAQLKEDLLNQQVKPLMQMQMVWYAIFDKEEMQLTEEEKDKFVKEIIASSGGAFSTKADVIETYGDYYIEMGTVSEMVFDFVEKNAKIS